MHVVDAVRAEESRDLEVAIIIRSRFLSSAPVVRSAVVVVCYYGCLGASSAHNSAAGLEWTR